MKSPAHRGYLKGIHYSNIIILSKDGKPLSTTSIKKATWYLKRKLAVEIIPAPPPYHRAIQLDFKDNSVQTPMVHDLIICDDKCVCCGKKKYLSLHHVIPYVIRRHFPTKYKKHSREWCVLLCIKCHDKAELLTKPRYMAHFPVSVRLVGDGKSDITLQMIKSRGHIDKVPPDKMKFLLKKSSYKNIDEIPAYRPLNKKEIHKKVSKIHQKQIKVWALKFIKSHGGIKGIKKYFAAVFLKMDPKFLPGGYLGMRPKSCLTNSKK